MLVAASSFFSFVSTFTAVSTTPRSCSNHLARLIAALFMAWHVSSVSLHSESWAVLCNKVFLVGPNHAPILAKLVTKITGHKFVELANLLSTILSAVDL